MIDLSIHESISTKLGLDIDIPNPGSGEEDIPNITSGGVLKATGSLDARLNFGIDLASPEDAYLYDTSRIDAELTVEGQGRRVWGWSSGPPSDPWQSSSSAAMRSSRRSFPSRG